MNLLLYASICTALTAIVMVFQAGLALGMPWGAASMGGKYPGRYPMRMRFVAAFNLLLLGFFILVFWSKTGLAFLWLSSLSHSLIWFLVGFFALGGLLNTITPSKPERIWAPVAWIQCLCSLALALS